MLHNPTVLTESCEEQCRLQPDVLLILKWWEVSHLCLRVTDWKHRHDLRVKGQNQRAEEWVSVFMNITSSDALLCCAYECIILIISLCRRFRVLLTQGFTCLLESGLFRLVFSPQSLTPTTLFKDEVSAAVCLYETLTINISLFKCSSVKIMSGLTNVGF